MLPEIGANAYAMAIKPNPIAYMADSSPDESADDGSEPDALLFVMVTRKARKKVLRVERRRVVQHIS